MSDPITTYQDIERIWLNADGGIKAALRAMAEYFDGQRRPVEVTDAAVEALAQELRGVWSDTEARSSWIHLPAKTKEEWLKVSRHVLASRRPKPEDFDKVANIMHAAAVKSGQMISSNQSDFMASAVLALYGAPPRKLEKWLANGTDKLRTELEAAYARIAALEAERGAPTFESLRQLFWGLGIHGEKGADLAREVVRMCDDPATTHAMILDAFDAAIEKANNG